MTLSTSGETCGFARAPLSPTISSQCQNASIASSSVSEFPQSSHRGASISQKDRLLGSPSFLTSLQLAELLEHHDKSNLLLLDVRNYKRFSESRIYTAVNLCIPTTLLKRTSFNVSKLSETFANERDKELFNNWKAMKYIVVYDNDTTDLTDSSVMTALHTLGKFSREEWSGQAYILRGGFHGFSKDVPNKVDKASISGSTNGAKSLTVVNESINMTGGMFICPLPAQQSVVNPFFSNIRQNMDLISGVGDLPIHLPHAMSSDSIMQLPTWLREVACQRNGSEIVAERFLKIEQAEQRRMYDALNVPIQYSPMSTKMKSHLLAGVEKGSKNRYNNIWPYDHCRVKLQDYPEEGCDYVNASHVKIRNGHRRYIASQAPLPSTFRDFWSMVWEQDVCVIVMLTAEEEGGMLKSHNYWRSGTYGSIRLNFVQERKVSLHAPLTKLVAITRSPCKFNEPPSIDTIIPFITVRRFTLEHTSRPFSQMREVTQLQYIGWPDLGAPTHPAYVLGLIEKTDTVVRSSGKPHTNHPVLVHCSAGCGRTGTFCTIDSVISMLKRQRAYTNHVHLQETCNLDSDIKITELKLENEDAWINDFNQDLVFKVVSELRDQRLSMVQCLQQYVLCYESVLEWIATQNPIDI